MYNNALSHLTMYCIIYDLKQFLKKINNGVTFEHFLNDFLTCKAAVHSVK